MLLGFYNVRFWHKADGLKRGLSPFFLEVIR